MKKLFYKIVILFIVLIICAFNVYATSENTVSNKTTNTTTEQKTEEKPTETAKNETMYVQERCNIRASYSTDSDRVGGLDAGTEVTVVAEYSNGWYKIQYDGGEAYIKAGILRSTKPEVEEEEESDEENSETNEEETTQNQEQTEEVTDGSTDEVSIEDAELINEIGVLPEVGKNIADYLMIGSIILAVSFVAYLKLIRKE